MFVNRCRNRLVILSVGSALMLSVMIGCGNSEGNEKPYGEDGYLGLSNSNPNLLSKPTTNRYNDDRNVIHQTLESIKGVNSSSVRFNGPYALVVVYVDEQMADEERRRVYDEAYQAVRDAMPRYHISMLIKGVVQKVRF